jgi:hypothetical protein
MNAQACYLWFAELAKLLQQGLGLPCSVEPRPMHVSITIDADTWLSVGDANGPVGYDVGNSAGEAGTFGETTCYVGDEVSAVASTLLPLLKVAAARTPRAALLAAGFTAGEVAAMADARAEEWEDAYLAASLRLEKHAAQLRADYAVIREAVAHVYMAMADDETGSYLAAIREVSRG